MFARSNANVNSSMIPLKPMFMHHVFRSTEVEKSVHLDIVNRMPGPHPDKSPRVVQFNTTKWVDHRTFALSMQVYGSISPHVMNIMGVTVMVDQFWKHKRGLLKPEAWGRHIIRCDIAEHFQDSSLDPSTIYHHFLEKEIGYKLDIMDLVFMPLHIGQIWYLIVANFRHARFEVFCPNEDIMSIKDDADVAIWNFQRTFKLPHSRSLRGNIFEMETFFCSVSKTKNNGVFVMQLIQKYDGNTHLYFRPEHAKPIREMLVFYMVANEHNEKLEKQLKVCAILKKYGHQPV
uniref:Ubiquitin-like protease family profile domain-containing protein n=1 Tax=Arundo donax TaxID=35708 RepID=A0A0A8ZVT8_ARUDO